MVGVGGVFAEADNRGEADPFAAVGGVDFDEFLFQFLLGRAEMDGFHKLRHAGVIDGGGAAHLLLLVRVLDRPHPVDTGGAVYIPARRPQL